MTIYGLLSDQVLTPISAAIMTAKKAGTQIALSYRAHTRVMSKASAANIKPSERIGSNKTTFRHLSKGIGAFNKISTVVKANRPK